MRIYIQHVLIISFVFILPSSAYPHSGRTDAQGGYNNRKTGGYHFHNKPKPKVFSRPNPAIKKTDEYHFQNKPKSKVTSKPIPAIREPEEERDRLLVVPLKVKCDISDDEAYTLTQILSAEIVRSDLFTVLDRDDMKAILNEKEFEQAMGCDEDSICLLENVASR